MQRLMALVCAAMATSPGLAETPPDPPAKYGTPIALSDALVLIERGRTLASKCGLAMAFAVVEPSGELVAFARMDGIPNGSTRLAQQKARTSARFRMTTAEFEERVQKGRLTLMSSDEVIAIGGGVPIIEGGRVIGGLGISGATAVQDAAIANAATTPPLKRPLEGEASSALCPAR
jgi:glc operon protein GlcG